MPQKGEMDVKTKRKPSSLVIVSLWLSFMGLGLALVKNYFTPPVDGVILIIACGMAGASIACAIINLVQRN